MLLANILLVKLGLSVEEISKYELFLFWTAAAGWFWLDAIIRAMLIRNSENNSDSFAILLLLSTLAAIVVFFIFPENSNAWLLSLYILFSYPANLIEYLFFLKNKTKALLVYAIISNILFIAIIIGNLLFHQTVEVIFSWLVVLSVAKFGYLTFLLQKTGFKLQLKNWQAISKLGIPLAGGSLVAGAAPYFDSWLVNRYFDAELFAIFRYGAKELPIVAIVANTFSNSMLPKFSTESAGAILSQIKNRSTKLMHLFFPISIVLILFANWLFTKVFSSEFEQSAGIFSIYLLLTASRLVFPQTILAGLQNTKVLFWVSVQELLINIVLSFMLMHYFGIQGIAMATVLAFYSEKLLLILFLKLKYHINASDYMNFKVLVLYTVIIFAAYFASAFNFIDFFIP